MLYVHEIIELTIETMSRYKDAIRAMCFLLDRLRSSGCSIEDVEKELEIALGNLKSDED